MQQSWTCGRLTQVGKRHALGVRDTSAGKLPNKKPHLQQGRHEAGRHGQCTFCGVLRSTAVALALARASAAWLAFSRCCAALRALSSAALSSFAAASCSAGHMQPCDGGWLTAANRFPGRDTGQSCSTL